MKTIVTVLIAMTLTGCALFEAEPYDLKRNVSTIHLKIDPMLAQRFDNEKGAMGKASVMGDTCYITLRSYPICLAHEVRHCFEGSWHPTGENFPGNSDDCY